MHNRPKTQHSQRLASKVGLNQVVSRAGQFTGNQNNKHWVAGQDWQRFSGIAGGKYTADDHNVCKEPAGGLAPPRAWLPASPAAEERKTSMPDNISVICAHLFIYLRFWCLIITDMFPVARVLYLKYYTRNNLFVLFQPSY